MAHAFLTLLDATTSILTLPGVRLSLLPGVVANATVTLTSLTDANTGVAVLGQTWPLTLVSAADGTGDYRATFDAALVVTARQRLRGVLTAVVGSVQRVWILDILVQNG